MPSVPTDDVPPGPGLAAIAWEGHATADQYRKLIENASDVNPLPMWIYDRGTLRFLAVNDAAVQAYGYSREEFLGLTIRDIRPPEDVPTLEASIRRSAGGDKIAGTWRHRAKNGTLMDVA